MHTNHIIAIIYHFDIHVLYQPAVVGVVGVSVVPSAGFHLSKDPDKLPDSSAISWFRG